MIHAIKSYYNEKMLEIILENVKITPNDNMISNL